MVRAFSWTLLGVVIPRLCYSALSLAQPLLINRVTLWLSNRNAADEDTGRGLIGATACIYIALAITNAIFKRQMHRLETKVRGALTTAIYTRTLKLSSELLPEGGALTFVTTDTARVSMALSRLDYLIGAPLELAVGIYLLKTQVGVSCVAPVAFNITISLLSFYDSNSALPIQKRFLAATSQRIDYTAAALGCAKGIKMLGLTDFLISKIQSLRVHELKESAAYRKYSANRNAFSFLPMAFSPTLTLMMFTLIHGQQALTPAVAFTTLALVQLVNNPIHEMIFEVPMVFTMLASLDRIQDFLLTGERESVSSSTDSFHAGGAGEQATQLTVLPTTESLPSQNLRAIQVNGLSVRLGKENKQVLHDVSFNAAAQALVMIIGPVGCGKSTLLKAILGDVKPSKGSVEACNGLGEFAYCAQDPWLPNDTVRGLVLGHSGWEEPWYERVIAACDLPADIATFADGDSTAIGSKGISLSGGQRQRLALARALYARKRVLIADDVFSGLDARTSRRVFDSVFGPGGLCKDLGITVLLTTHAVQYMQHADWIVALSTEGHMAESGIPAELDRLVGYVYNLNPETTSCNELEEMRLGSPSAKPNGTPAQTKDAQQDLARRTGDTALYGYYIGTLGPTYTSLILATCVLFAFGLRFPDVLVRLWSESATGPKPKYSIGLWIGLLSLLALIALASLWCHIYVLLVWGVPKSSAQIHKRVLDKVMRATYSFHVATDSGVTLNRFSSDMALIDGQLAGSVMQTMTALAIFIAGAALIAAGAQYLGIAMPFVLFLLYILQKIYLRTSRQLRFMDLEAQAPLLTHISETSAGVTTIRAFGWQTQVREKMLDLLNVSQRPFYLLLCIQRWLNLVLDLVTAALAVIVVAVAIMVSGTSSAGSVGVSLLNVLTFTSNLSELIVAWTALETALGAVARCRNFERSTASEDKPCESSDPPAEWPMKGELVFDNVSAAYQADGEDVLKGLNLHVEPGQKIGICGRSGSGKSSFLLTLLRLLDNNSGCITLDGIDLASITRQSIRSRLAALPQETLTLPGTLRQNLGPLEKHVSDEDAYVRVLSRVGLLGLVEQRGGLNAPMSELSLSQGQLQLFALARASLHKSKVLILDEMTSSVDAASEELMMDIILDEVRQSTIIAVAHRLQSIRHFDRMVVMDAGRIVDTGEPGALLKREGSAFKAMWERNGH